MILIKLQEHFPLRVADWLVSGILLSWGVTVLYLPEEAWQLPAYVGLHDIADKTTWGTFAAVIGLVRMSALFVNGALRRSPHVRMLGAFLSIFLWLQLCFGLFMVTNPAISVAIYPWLLCADMYNVGRAAQDARLSDIRFKTLARGALRNAPSP